MWSVLSLVRQGLRRRRRAVRVVDESALGHASAGHDIDAGHARAAAPSLAGALSRALLAIACAIHFNSEGGGAEDGSAEEAWAASVWRPRADEVSHLMVRESMRYAIYA